MRFASLGSGSQGNALVVEVARTCLMLDCGFSLRETVSRLARVGLDPSDLRGIIVTHEHADHGEGVFPFARRFGVPVWLTHGTLVALRETLADADEECSFNLIDSQCNFPVDDLLVQPITVPHDAREPVQYVLSDGASRLGVPTDPGCQTAHVESNLSGCDALVLECNYDSNASQPDRCDSMCAVEQPVSVRTPSRLAPSESTYWTGSRASCGTVIGCTSRSSTGKLHCESIRLNEHSSSASASVSRRATSVPCVSHTGTPKRRANGNTPSPWSACSCVTSIPRRSEGSRPTRARRDTVSRSEKPQSSMRHVRATSTTRALPWLPLPSEAKRITEAAPDLRDQSAQGYFSCCCSRERILRAVSEDAGSPSLLRTCTSLESLRSFTKTRYCSALGSGAERQNMSLARKLSFFLSSASASGSTYRTK